MNDTSRCGVCLLKLNESHGFLVETDAGVLVSLCVQGGDVRLQSLRRRLLGCRALSDAGDDRVVEIVDARPAQRVLFGVEYLGEQQRVAIARAVITKPGLLLADEPTGNVDDEMAKRLLYLFEQLNKMGTTVLIATHNEALIQEFEYPHLHLQEGQVHAV